jgi:tetratricopeptide (TPR) repeat protein
MAVPRAWRYFAIAGVAIAAGAVVVAAATAEHASEGDHYYVHDASVADAGDPASRAALLEAEAQAIDDIDRARPKWDEALALRDALPGVVDRTSNRVHVATAYVLAQRYAEAREVVIAARQIDGTSLVLAQLLGNIDLMLHQLDDAASDGRALIALAGQANAPPMIATGDAYLGVALLGGGNEAAAKTAFEAALHAVARSPIEQAETHVTIAAYLHELHRNKDALVHAQAAAEIVERELGSVHPETVADRMVLAKMLLSTNQPEKARPIAEAVLARYEQSHAPAGKLAEARLLVARSLPKSERAHAIELATQALDVLNKAGAAFTTARRRAEAWLASPDTLDL